MKKNKVLGKMSLDDVVKKINVEIVEIKSRKIYGEQDAKDLAFLEANKRMILNTVMAKIAKIKRKK